MDNKLLCPTLSMMLVKTIKALCEINIHYDQKLEITGSLHVRSDGNKVLTCLLDEETIKGSHHETAARVAELAARLSLANAAAFTFQHVPLTAPPPSHTPSNQSQQIAEALLTSLNTHPPSTSSSSGNVSMAGNSLSSKSDYSGYYTLSANNAAPSSVPVLPSDQRNPSLIVVSPISPAGDVSAATMHDNLSTEWNGKQRQSSADSSPALSMFSGLRNGEVDGGGFSAATSRRSGKRMDSVGKTAVKAGSTIAVTAYSPSSVLNLTASPGNHIKLPDIQTLAHRLPGFQSVVSTSVDVSPAIESAWNMQTPPPDVGVIERPLSPPSAADVEISTESPMSSAGVDGESPPTSAGGGTTLKKKFQCMFCGIFLSTKCYLKNHINAVHTRSRIYQCDLCAHYFYSAGAARIHKLRNHWQDAKKHRCSECAETFLLPIELRKHMQKKHYDSVGYQLIMDAAKLEPGEVLPAQQSSTSDASADGATNPDS